MLTSQTKVLLVDDFDLMRTMLRKSLEEMGYQDIHDSHDGEDATTKIEKAHSEGQPYGAIFLDWNMPKKTGIEVLEWCRTNSLYKDLIIIMVTAEAEKKHVFNALMKGANDYIVKPCSAAILKSKIDHVNERLNKKAS